MSENILDVRLLHAAKPLNSIYDTSTTPPTLVTQGWSDVVTPPKKGEVCLEIQGTNPPLSYKIKIGDGTSSYLTLPYFGTTVNVGQGTSIVRVVNTDPVEGTPIPPELWFYKIALDKSDVAGVTTITPVIGDLYLKVKEGDKIDFNYKTENLTTPELTFNHETVTATTDAVAITDGGTFTAATTKDNYGHVTKLTTFTLPSIDTAVTSAIEALDKSNLDLVEWDSTNGVLTMYPIYETDGVIYKGSTASYTLDLSTYVGNVVHDVKINNTSILDNNNEANLAVAGTYNASTNKIATESTVSDAVDTAIGSLDAAAVGGTDKVITTISETDGVISATAVNKTDVAPVQGVTTTDTGDSGIEITTSNNVKDVHHKTVVQDDTDTSSIIGEKDLPVITGVSVDSYGHITGVTKDISSNLIAADIKAPMTFTDKDAWLIRPTGGNHDVVSEDIARVTELEGNSCVWNQLVQNGNFENGTTGWNTYAASATVSDGVVTVSKISSGGTGAVLFTNSLIPNTSHKYYIAATAKVEDNSYMCYVLFQKNGIIGTNVAITTQSTSWERISGIVTPSNNDDDFGLRVGLAASPANATGYFKDVICIDLTLLGIDNLTTTAQVEAWLAQHVGTKPYYAYNAGTILSAQTLGIKTYGQNLLNPTTRQAKLIPYTWEENSNVYTIKNVPSGATATFTPDNTGVAETVDISGGSLDITSYGSGVLELSAATADTYVCFKWDGTKDNDVVPHVEHRYGFDVRKVYGKNNNVEYQCYPDGMRSAGGVHDTLTGNEAVVKVGSVDLGTLTWTYRVYDSQHEFDALVADKISRTYDTNLLCEKYPTIAASSASSFKDKTINGWAGFGIKRVIICDSDYSDANNFKTAINGVMLNYELATPITYTDLVYRDNGVDRPLADVLVNINVNNWGIEEQLLTPYVDGNPTSTAATITMQYKSNFKDAIKDLIDKVNNQKNPVMGVSNTGQTVDKIAIYDSASTVHSSSYSPSNATIVEGATGNDIILPAVETIVNYVNTKLSSALTYKGTISEWSDLPTSGQSTGDMYIADTTFTESGVTYQAGDFFIWNGTDWDIVSGTTSVVNSNPTLSLDGGTYQVGTVDGIALQVTTPNLDYSSPTASGTSLEYIDSVSQSNGLISATKKSLPNASTTQAGVTSFVTDIHYSTDNEKTATAKQIWVECEKRNVQFVEAGVVPTGLPMTEDEFINTYTYGVKWVQGSSECTRVGNSSLHETMPIHNALRACVYQIVPQEVTVTETIDGVDYTLNYGAKREFRYWLDDDDWNKKADGTPSVLTGEDMTGIAIWHPKFYGKSFDGVVDGSTSYNSVYVSLVQYDNTWTEIKEGYVDFAKMQTVSSNGVNYARSFGNPDFSVDNPSTTEMTLSAINTWIQTQKDSTQSLVKSQVSTNRLTANQYAMNAGAHLMSLDEYKWIFCWLPVIECAAFTVEENTHFDWQDGSDTNIVMRDSLSNVPSWMYYGMYSANCSAITGTYGGAFVPAGYTNKLGTHTGWIKMRLPNSGGTYDSKIASRWRGFEIQRNIWTNLMGVNPVQTNTSGTVDVYSTKNRALWNNDMPIDITDESTSTHANIMPWDSRDAEEPEYTTLTGWEHKGIQKWSGYGTEFDLGSDGNPTYRTLGSSKPDYHYGAMSNINPRCFIAGGNAVDASYGGPFYFGSGSPVSYAYDRVGFRCCWNIDEYNSVLN